MFCFADNFDGAFMKALRSLEDNVYVFHIPDVDGLSLDELRVKLKDVDDHRIFVVAQALRQGMSEQEIHDITRIDCWFIDKIKHLTEVEQQLKTSQDIHQMRLDHHIEAVYKTVDTCAAEFDATTPYYYSVYGEHNEVDPRDDK